MSVIFETYFKLSELLLQTKLWLFLNAHNFPVSHESSTLKDHAYHMKTFEHSLQTKCLLFFGSEPE